MCVSIIHSFLLLSLLLELISYQKQFIRKNGQFAYNYGIQRDKSNNVIRVAYFIDRRFRSLIPSYIRDSNVAVIVFDITSEVSL